MIKINIHKDLQANDHN